MLRAFGVWLRRGGVVAACLVLTPSLAHANAGTAMMMAGMLHLFVGNLVIGAVEGVLLAWWFGANKYYAWFYMILANYASAWIGIFIVPLMMSPIEVTVENIALVFTVMLLASMLITYLLSALIEFPFVHYSFRPHERRFRRSVLATLTVSACTYAALILYYAYYSTFSFLTAVTVVPPESLRPPAAYELYYISKDRKAVMRAGLDGADPVKVADIEPTDSMDRLVFRRGEGDRFSLCLVSGFSYSTQTGQIVQKNVATEVPQTGTDRATSPEQDTWMAFGEAPVLGNRGGWTLETNFWPTNGLWGVSNHGEYFGAGLETPFVSWYFRNATLIDGEYAVFQILPDQICLLHLPTRRVALVARGYGPTVAKKQPDEEAQPDEENVLD